MTKKDFNFRCKSFWCILDYIDEDHTPGWYQVEVFSADSTSPIERKYLGTLQVVCDERGYPGFQFQNDHLCTNVRIYSYQGKWYFWYGISELSSFDGHDELIKLLDSLKAEADFYLEFEQYIKSLAAKFEQARISQDVAKTIAV